ARCAFLPSPSFGARSVSEGCSVFPSPLVGEGSGVRGKRPRRAGALTPHPRPLSRKGRGEEDKRPSLTLRAPTGTRTQHTHTETGLTRRPRPTSHLAPPLADLIGGRGAGGADLPNGDRRDEV